MLPDLGAGEASLSLTNPQGTMTGRRGWQTLFSYVENQSRVSYWGLQGRNLGKSSKLPPHLWTLHPDYEADSHKVWLSHKRTGTDTTALIQCCQLVSGIWRTLSYFPFFYFFFFNYSVIVTPWRFTAKCSKIKSWSLDQTQISCLFKTVNCIGQIPSFWYNSADLERATHTL